MKKSTPLISLNSPPSFEKIYSKDWLYFAEQAKLKKTLKIPQAQRCTQLLLPASAEYYSDLNPIFLFECPHLSILNRRPIWLIRDGLVPLSWFFQIHPRPDRVTSKLLVHHSLTGFVPAAWRKQTGSYEIVSYPKIRTSAKKRLLVTGLVLDHFCSVPHLEVTLKKFKKSPASKYALKNDILSFIIPSQYKYWNPDNQIFPFLYTVTLCKYLGTRFSPIDANYMGSPRSYSDYQVLELNDRLLCADSFLVHKPLSQGAQLWSEKPPKPLQKDETYTALSPFHGARVKMKLSGPAQIDTASWSNLESLHNAIFSRNTIQESQFPWPTWMTDWGISQLAP